MPTVVSTPALAAGASVHPSHTVLRSVQGSALRATQPPDITIMPKPNSRQRILAYLQTHPALTATELARALRVTPANIRHHLSILVADGRAKVLGERPSQGRGRPLQVYGLGELAMGDNLSNLADVALSQWLTALSPDQQDSALESLAAQLADVAPGLKTNAITRRLALTIEHLNKLHYQARWEAHAQGPRVIFEHCPYAAIIGKHPELCRMDKFLLQQLLGTEATQSAKLELNARGLAFCMFVVK
jgi:predicted ArsR family transcriptional regulator